MKETLIFLCYTKISDLCLISCKNWGSHSCVTEVLIPLRCNTMLTGKYWHFKGSSFLQLHRQAIQEENFSHFYIAYKSCVLVMRQEHRLCLECVCVCMCVCRHMCSIYKQTLLPAKAANYLGLCSHHIQNCQSWLKVREKYTGKCSPFYFFNSKKGTTHIICREKQ